MDICYNFELENLGRSQEAVYSAVGTVRVRFCEPQRTSEIALDLLTLPPRKAQMDLPIL